MTDIVARLRAAFDGGDVPCKNIALRQAADEIKRLRKLLADALAAACNSDAEIERLRAELAEAQSVARQWRDVVAAQMRHSEPERPDRD